MLRFTTTTLKKIEVLCKEAGYTVRYEKGQFQPGYCLLEKKKVIVVNKFLSVESRINTLLDLLDLLDIDPDRLSPASKNFYTGHLVKREEPF